MQVEPLDYWMQRSQDYEQAMRDALDALREVRACLDVLYSDAVPPHGLRRLPKELEPWAGPISVMDRVVSAALS